ncbi:hypothetical protein PXD04_07745 [Methanosphaera sp. ISO3-F5]|uniref:hypothetical protein n=1 Tax=Methanosphaera sp. ISO3-F5 TaxID=1452353 RepID=UPI002B263380|nr:hypothetical protein [Methanosphaera sp. ISO3-F5]WQH63589.1 hypothetical protein PXD04_07745 [Methanosphaera sp. ISO3-F5]
MQITKITFEEIPVNLQSILDSVINKLKTDNIYDTNKGYYILENTELNRIYIEIYNHEIYDGLTMEELNTLIEHFKINDPHIFSYPYTHEDSLICIGKIEENEIIY